MKNHDAAQEHSQLLIYRSKPIIASVEADSLASALNNCEIMKQKIVFLTGLVVAILALPLSLNAQTISPTMSSASPSGTPTASAEKQTRRPVPFHGMISAVDQTAKTFTIAGKDAAHVFKVTDKTAITRSGKPATIADLTENQEVSGAYWKHPDGTLEAKKVKIGPRKEKEAMTSPSASAPATPIAKP